MKYLMIALFEMLKSSDQIVLISYEGYNWKFF